MSEGRGRSLSLPTGAEKLRYVRRMFTGIAGRYDFMNRVMTLGMDRAWRRAAVAELGCSPGDLVLDVGTGTGDFLCLLAGLGCRAVGLDLTADMMRAGQGKLTRLSTRPSFVQGDAVRLPFPDDCFEGLVNGFLLRNVADLPGALAEMARVVRPGGRVACLEITWPSVPIFREVFGVYFGRMVPVMGRLLTGDGDAYSYLPRSVAAFVSPVELAALMAEAGLRQVRYRPMALGAVALHVGVKPGG